MGTHVAKVKRHAQPPGQPPGRGFHRWIFLVTMIPIKHGTGFFRFPARITTRVVFCGAQVVRMEDSGGDPARTTFRVRHNEPAPADGPREEIRPKLVPVRGPAARITWRF